MDEQTPTQTEPQATNPQPADSPAAASTPPAAPEQPATNTSAPAAPAPSSKNPGQTFGIISIVLAILGIGIGGLILGIIGYKKSKKAGAGTGLSLAGIIISVLSTIVGLLLILTTIAGVQRLVQKCDELGPGTHYVDNATYTCLR